MVKSLTRFIVIAVALSGTPASAQNGVTLTFANGRVTLVATNAPLGQILAEWQRLGGTRFVNSDRLPGSLVTVELTDVPERQALAVLLRPFSGYMASAGAVDMSRASSLAVVVVMPTLARANAAPTPSNASSNFRPPAQPQPTNRGFGVRPGIQVGTDPNADPSDPDMGGDPQDEPGAFPPGMPGGVQFPGMPTDPTDPPDPNDPNDPAAAVPQLGGQPGFPGAAGTAVRPGMTVPGMPTPAGGPPRPPKPPGSPEPRVPIT